MTTTWRLATIAERYAFIRKYAPAWRYPGVWAWAGGSWFVPLYVDDAGNCRIGP
jgi:hypothetical protein